MFGRAGFEGKQRLSRTQSQLLKKENIKRLSVVTRLPCGRHGAERN